MRIRIEQESKFRIFVDRHTYAEWSSGRLRIEAPGASTIQIEQESVAEPDDVGGRAVQAQAGPGGGADGRRAASAEYQSYPGPVLHTYSRLHYGPGGLPIHGPKEGDGGAEKRTVDHGGGRGGERGEPSCVTVQADPDQLRDSVRRGAYTPYIGRVPSYESVLRSYNEDTGEDNRVCSANQCVTFDLPRDWTHVHINRQYTEQAAQAETSKRVASEPF